MSTNQLTVTAMAFILAAFTLGAAAAPNDKDNPGKAGPEQRAVNSHKQAQGSQNPAAEIVVRGNESRGRENSNRQSDPGATRGQERAGERRSESADQHARSGEGRHWYDFFFRGDKDKGQNMAEKKLRWWWPFN